MPDLAQTTGEDRLTQFGIAGEMGEFGAQMAAHIAEIKELELPMGYLVKQHHQPPDFQQ
jgi:hypothetical protein